MGLCALEDRDDDDLHALMVHQPRRAAAAVHGELRSAAQPCRRGKAVRAARAQPEVAVR